MPWLFNPFTGQFDYYFKSSLSNLLDVNLSSLQDDDLLIYDVGTSKWYNIDMNSALAAMLTTVGSIAFRDTAQCEKLDIGSEDDILTVSGGKPVWAGWSFLSLPDTPSAYTGKAGYGLVVNSGVNAIEFTGQKLSTFIQYTPTDYALAIVSSGSSTFSALINGSPSGTSVVYDTITGNENSITPYSSTVEGKLVLHNITRGNSALINSVNTATNTITLTATVPANWADNDVIQVNSLTALSGGSPYYFDLDLSAVIPSNATEVFMAASVRDTAAANGLGAVHPYAAIVGDALRQNCRTQIANVYIHNAFVLPVISQKICIQMTASGAATLNYVLRMYGYWVTES